jgi:hypothetical protein
MSAKSITALVGGMLGASCFVPAAILAYQTQVRHFAFEGISAAVVRPRTGAVLPAPSLAAAMQAEPDDDAGTGVRLATAEVSPSRKPSQASKVTGVRARGCETWRALHAGPTSLAASVGPVRVCEGAPPSATRRAASRSPGSGARPRAARAPMTFVFDLGAPR